MFQINEMEYELKWWNDMMSYLSMQELNFVQTDMSDQDKIC